MLLAATSLISASMGTGISDAYREVQRRDADEKDRERIEAAKAKRARKAAKRLAAAPSSSVAPGSK
jgi:hypothetical protein